MTRIILAGEPAQAGLRGSLATAFLRSGCEVDVLDLGPWDPAWLRAAAFRQPVLGTRFRREFRRHVDVIADTGRADLVLIVKGAFLDSAAIDHLRNRFGSPVVCWNPDSPFDQAISNRGAGIRPAIAAYDAYITWAQDVAEQLLPVASRVLVIPFAWDPELMAPTSGRGVAEGRIVFIGTASKERCACLAGLAQFRPMVFGSQWPNIDGIDIRPPVRGLDFCRIVGEARWNLNLLRPQNARSHNMRTFELVGAGGAQVAPRTDDHEKFLGDDTQTALFRSEDELNAILHSDSHERQARLPDLLENHTYHHRVSMLLAELGIL